MLIRIKIKIYKDFQLVNGKCHKFDIILNFMHTRRVYPRKNNFAQNLHQNWHIDGKGVGMEKRAKRTCTRLNWYANEEGIHQPNDKRLSINYIEKRFARDDEITVYVNQRKQFETWLCFNLMLFICWKCCLAQ